MRFVIAEGFLKCVVFGSSGIVCREVEGRVVETLAEGDDMEPGAAGLNHWPAETRTFRILLMGFPLNQLRNLPPCHYVCF